jgi:gamma-glutamyltranspeptidase/glutathione hydrolase
VTAQPGARAVAVGARGAVAAGHPLAVGAAIETFSRGGNAVDAAVAAQAVVAVVLPDACGVGGDALALVRTPDGVVTAVNGAGPSAAADGWRAADDGGASVTVPGALDAWERLVEHWGRLRLATVVAPAVRIARVGFRLDPALASARSAQEPRLRRGGGTGWSVLETPVGQVVRQPELGDLLEAFGRDGAAILHGGTYAAAVARAVQRTGGDLSVDDLATPPATVARPLSTSWDGGVVHVQPPMSQGVLLAAALRWCDRAAAQVATGAVDHIAVEVTEAVFALRDRCAEGAALLAEPLAVDLVRAARRGGPRSYLHTTGVATADADGTVVSSLASVFDDFGSGTLVPEGGFVLNNRAGGFTAAPNDAAPAKRPVHTLAPALVERGGEVTALATPGADGQIQTLLQILARMRWAGADLADAIAAPRWRSEGGRLLIESGHEAADRLAAAGHELVAMPAGDGRAGAVVAAGLRDGFPVASGDWRRQVSTGVL